MSVCVKSFLQRGHDTRLLDVVPVADDDVAALRVEVPEVGAAEALAAVPAAVLVQHHVVLARHQLRAQVRIMPHSQEGN